MQSFAGVAGTQRQQGGASGRAAASSPEGAPKPGSLRPSSAEASAAKVSSVKMAAEWLGELAALALRAAGVARHALNEAASALGVKDGLRGRDGVRVGWGGCTHRRQGRISGLPKGSPVNGPVNLTQERRGKKKGSGDDEKCIQL